MNISVAGGRLNRAAVLGLVVAAAAPAASIGALVGGFWVDMRVSRGVMQEVLNGLQAGQKEQAEAIKELREEKLAALEKTVTEIHDDVKYRARELENLDRRIGNLEFRLERRGTSSPAAASAPK